MKIHVHEALHVNAWCCIVVGYGSFGIGAQAAAEQRATATSKVLGVLEWCRQQAGRTCVVLCRREPQ